MELEQINLPKSLNSIHLAPIMFNSRNNRYFIDFLVLVGVLSLFGCSPSEQPKMLTPTITPTQSSSEIEEKRIKANTLTIGILSKPSYYQELTTYLRSQFGNKVQIVIDGDESIPYEEARKRIINKEWDIAFTLSPMLSVSAKDNGYHFAARMFAYNPPYYQAALYAKSNSPIQSLNDLKSTTSVALGDFNSASSFYMPAYDLFGKSLRVDMGHRGTKIKELVKAGKVDLGAGAYETVKNDKELRVIHVSRQIPGSNVYLSPNLSEVDRETIIKVLLNAPEQIKKQANYGSGKEPDYSYFIQISKKAEEVLKCANFQRNPVNFFCSNASATQNFNNAVSSPSISGRINGWSRKDSENEIFSLSGQDGKVYQILVSRKVLNQVSGASNPIALQNKQVKIIDVVPAKTQQGLLELTITQPNQLSLLANIATPNEQSVYTVQSVEDGDTITVTDVFNQETRVRFACIDTAEVPHSDAENNSQDPIDKNQFVWGNKAKQRLVSLIKQGGNRVLLNIVDTDRYGRKVAEVRLTNGTFAQQVLVREGLAMVYRQYIKSCPSATDVEQAEAEAKQQQLNIWADSQFTPPWDWRRNKKSSLKKQAKV